MRCAALPLTIALAGAAPAAPTQPIAHDAELWGMVTAQGPIAGSFVYYLEAQSRTSATHGGPYQGLLRYAAGYKFGAATFQVGAAWVPALGEAAVLRVGEGRFFEEVIATQQIGPAALLGRLRLEQRSIDGVPHIAHRVRGLGRGTLPLAFEDTIYAVAWDELMFHLNGPAGGPRAGFDQNRAFLGLGWKLTAVLSLEGGYLNRALLSPSALAIDHALFLWLAFRFPLP